MRRRRTEGLKGSETILYDTIMADTHHFTSIQAHGMYNTESEHSPAPRDGDV